MCNRMQSAILREMADILPKISADGRLFCSCLLYTSDAADEL